MTKKWRYVTPQTVIDSANLQTDEDFTNAQLGFFFNEGISDMNIQLNLNMPLLDLSASPLPTAYTLEKVYNILPDVYMMSAMQYYVSYAIKAQDSSNNEAELFWQKYMNIITQMKGSTDDFIDYTDPETGQNNSDYGGISQSAYEMSFEGSPYVNYDYTLKSPLDE